MLDDGGVLRSPWRGGWHIFVGLVIALCKATLVILFFMHALISPRLTWSVIVVTAFWVGILLVMTLNDYFSPRDGSDTCPDTEDC